MKKEYLLVILALSVGVIFYFFGTRYTPLKNFPPRNDIIVAFGDSLICGRGSTPGNDFISVLSRKLKKPIINLGVSGNTTADGLARVDEVIQNNPGTVIVLFGGNDYLQKVSEKQTFDNLREIISKLQSRGAFVVLLGIQGGLFSDNFENSFEDLSKEMGTAYVPNVFDGVFGNPRYMAEVVHPNDIGYAKIADKVYKEMKKYVW